MPFAAEGATGNSSDDDGVLAPKTGLLFAKLHTNWFAARQVFLR
jgi:hypothetical protein